MVMMVILDFQHRIGSFFSSVISSPRPLSGIVKVVMFDKGELEPVLGGVYSYTDAASLRLVTQNSI